MSFSGRGDSAPRVSEDPGTRWMTDARLSELLIAISGEEENIRRLREASKEMSEVSEAPLEDGSPITSLETRRRRLTEANASRELAAESLEEAREGTEAARSRRQDRILDLYTEGMPLSSWVRSGDTGAFLARRDHEGAAAEVRLYRAPWWAVEKAYRRDPDRAAREPSPVTSVVKERLSASSTLRENLLPLLLNAFTALGALAAHIFFAWPMLLGAISGDSAGILALPGIALLLVSSIIVGLQAAGTLNRARPVWAHRSSIYGELAWTTPRRASRHRAASTEEMRLTVSRLEKPPCARIAEPVSGDGPEQ